MQGVRDPGSFHHIISTWFPSVPGEWWGEGVWSALGDFYALSLCPYSFDLDSVTWPHITAGGGWNFLFSYVLKMRRKLFIEQLATL